jgi:hypothetical protein
MNRSRFAVALLPVALAAGLVWLATLQGAQAQSPTVASAIDTSKPFNHDHHMNADTVGKEMRCDSCHKMTKADGTCPKQEVRFPDHDACISCHAESFYTSPLTICVNCHTEAAFKAKNPVKELTRQVTPRKAEFSHASHIDSGNCQSCHAFVKAGEKVTHPSHPNCCQCHADGAVQPQMNNCQGCHSESKNAGRPPSKIHDFSHKTHREDPRNGASLDCNSCHINTANAKTLRSIPTPPMSTCVQCHDGSDPGQPHPTLPGIKGSGAFSFTQCLKCHIPGSIKGVPLPPSHPAPGATP